MGASNNERLLAAARSDNEDLLMEIFERPGSFDINYRDGIGNTALHNAVLHESISVLDHILCHKKCDVDPTNTLEGATPLHLAVKLEDSETRVHFVKALLEAGADYLIRNKNGETALDLVKTDDPDVLLAFRKAQATAHIDKGDIAYDDDDDMANESD